MIAQGSPVLTAEELLAGAELEYDVEIPAEVIRPGAARSETPDAAPRRVRLRPLRLKDVQLIARAARGDEVLTSVLMIQRALVEPELDQRAISRMSSGLVRWLVDHINRISGLTSSDDEVRELAGAPIVQTFFVLAKEFGWTPDEIRALTVGQVLGYLELLTRTRRGATA